MQRQIKSFLILGLVGALACATTPAAPDPDPPGPVAAPADPQAKPDPASPSGKSRADAAVESMIMGAMVGSIFGWPGAAAGALGLAIYGAVTGNVPLSGSGSGGARGSDAEAEDEMEREIETELAKQDELEAEIEAELERQEELLEQIDRDEKLREAESQPAETGATASVDPLDAPRAPVERDLPASIFEEKPRQVAKGEWGNDRPIEVLARSLDADRRAPEEVPPRSETLRRKR
jgi:hypothetical protein